MKKIKAVVKEATENVADSKVNKFSGKTRDGIPVEWYVNTEGKIKTAYILIDKL